ncbi:MAG: hypothetical protein Hyperionvirus2_84 [Hyperionvirus sp.]|uniref:Uncharacterized protein n=1 Tax=Hyperionvirus sp. TaxID=2487770 RepID=A0A3G5A640_9VIRU|nr:MAG: hypothetical protein Hyperionvirus2_84 [Hyperionvirus sp.]
MGLSGHRLFLSRCFFDSHCLTVILHSLQVSLVWAQFSRWEMIVAPCFPIREVCLHSGLGHRSFKPDIFKRML